MIEITIDGLNPRQQLLADMIWACDSRADVERFIRGLASTELKQEAENIVNLMIMATVEQAYDGLGTMDEARALISKARKG
jgi:hypothetical protein